MSEIWKALLAAQGELPALQRDGTNPHFKNDYVTLETLIGAVLPVLNKNGIVLVQAPNMDGESDVLLTQLIHAESEQSCEAKTRLYPVKDDPQAFGSALTYARRYALMSLLGLVADADDDGNAASPQAPRRQARPASDPAVFNPAKDRINGAIEVKSAADADALQRAQRDLDPEADWPANEELLSRAVFDKASPEGKPEWGEWWNRLANAVAQAWSHGDLVSRDEVLAAYAAHFNGAVIVLSGDLTAREEEAGAESTPNGEDS